MNRNKMDGKDPPGNPPRRRRGGGGEARSFLASARAVTAAAALLDGSVALFDMQKRRREEEELEAEIEEQRQMLDSLQQSVDELKVKQEAARDFYINLNKFLKEGNPDQTAQQAEQERSEELRLEAALQRQKLLHAGLMETEQQQRRWIHRNAVYRELLVRTVRMTKFEDVQRLTGHIESLLHFQDDFYKRENQAHGQVEQLKESLLTLEDDHCLLQLQSNHQLSQLQSQIEKMRSEALSWERQWNHIQETAAQKTLLLGRIKMATFNLYEMTDAMVEGEHTLTMNDTEKQLEKVQMFIRDYEGLVKY